MKQIKLEINPGDRFERLTVIKEISARRYATGRVHRRVLLKCDCGNKTIQFLNSLRSNKVVSCGCYRNTQNRTARLTHGLSRHRIMVIWNCMIGRCRRPKNPEYKNYGGRGIRVCKRWLKFAGFLEDMGLPPQGYGIDRKDPNGHYCKRNCQWSPAQDCSMGTRKAIARRILYQGKRVALARLAKQKGIPYSTLYHRIRKQGMSPENSVNRAIEQP